MDDLMERMIATADALEANKRVSLAWARRSGRTAFRDALDVEMRDRGWDVEAPGRYRRPRDG